MISGSDLSSRRRLPERDTRIAESAQEPETRSECISHGLLSAPTFFVVASGPSGVRWAKCTHGVAGDTMRTIRRESRLVLEFVLIRSDQVG